MTGLSITNRWKMERKRNSLEQARQEVRDLTLRIRSLQMQHRAALKAAYVAGLVRGSSEGKQLTVEQAEALHGEINTPD